MEHHDSPPSSPEFCLSCTLSRLELVSRAGEALSPIQLFIIHPRYLAAFIMAGGTPVGEVAIGSDLPRQKGIATPDTLKSGCIAWVEKDGQPRRAEILSIKETKSGKQFYCNFDNFNKRLDEWVPVARIDFTQEVEWPNPEKDKLKDAKAKKAPPATKKAQISKKNQKRTTKREQSVSSEIATPHPWTGWFPARARIMLVTDKARFRRIASSNPTRSCQPRR